ncbi:MAG: hypothetical protein ACRENK_15735 [Gemmatimonadaceae bacterium]
MNTLRMSEEQLHAYNAKRARECAIADGRVETSMDCSVATIESVVAIEQARAPLERDIQRAVLLALKLHPKVALAWRQNTGAARYDEAYVKFSFRGCSDILGMLVGGRLLAIEVKRAGKDASADQHAFIAAVRQGGGVAFVARGVDDVIRELATA